MGRGLGRRRLGTVTMVSLVLVAAVGAVTPSRMPEARGQAASIEFWAEPEHLENPGDCTTLYWRVSGDPSELFVASAVGDAFTGMDLRTRDDAWSDNLLDQGLSAETGFMSNVCLAETGKFQLKVEYPSGAVVYSEEVWITVGAGSGTMATYLVVTDSDLLDTQLASSGGSWSDVETLLDARYGADGYEVLDFADDLATAGRASFTANQAALRDLITREGRPRYLIIIGGPDVVPFGEVTNPCSDGDVVYTDDWYSDLDDDSRHLPDVPLARVPDGGDIDLIEAVFAANARPRPRGDRNVYTHGHPLRQYVYEVASRLLDGDTSAPDWRFNPKITPWPDDVRPWLEIGQDATLTYFILHGARSDTSQWWGEDPDVPLGQTGRYPVAETVETVSSSGLVVTGACYGAYIDEGKDTSNSLALAFLDSGAYAFVGSTTTNYSAPPDQRSVTHCWTGPSGRGCRGYTTVLGDVLGRGAQAMHWAVLDNASDGQHPLDAYFDAKYDFAATIDAAGMWTCGEQKVLPSFVYYGLPPVVG